MEKHVAVNHLCRTPWKSLAHPYRRQSVRDVLPPKPLVEAFTNFSEKPTIGVVPGFRARPMDRGVSVQWRTDFTSELHRLHDVRSLAQSDALALAWSGARRTTCRAEPSLRRGG